MEESKEENKKEIKLVEKQDKPKGNKSAEKLSQNNKANMGELRDDSFFEIRSVRNTENMDELKKKLQEKSKEQKH